MLSRVPSMQDRCGATSMPVSAIVLATVFGAAIVSPAASMGATGTPHLILTLKDGDVDIQLLPDIAPKHVERIITLTNQGFYNGLTFHRVIDGFMAQTGDPTGTGAGGSSLPDVVAEFSNTHYAPGTVGDPGADHPVLPRPGGEPLPALVRHLPGGLQ